jgi:hypothetical protein
MGEPALTVQHTCEINRSTQHSLICEGPTRRLALLRRLSNLRLLHCPHGFVRPDHFLRHIRGGYQRVWVTQSHWRTLPTSMFVQLD